MTTTTNGNRLSKRNAIRAACTIAREEVSPLAAKTFESDMSLDFSVLPPFARSMASDFADRLAHDFAQWIVPSNSLRSLIEWEEAGGDAMPLAVGLAKVSYLHGAYVLVRRVNLRAQLHHADSGRCERVGLNEAIKRTAPWERPSHCVFIEEEDHDTETDDRPWWRDILAKTFGGNRVPPLELLQRGMVVWLYAQACRSIQDGKPLDALDHYAEAEATLSAFEIEQTKKIAHRSIAGRGGAARINNSPLLAQKKEAIDAIKRHYFEWEDDQTLHASKAAFARAMLEKYPSVKSERNITNRVREWGAGGSVDDFASGRRHPDG